MSRLIDLTHTLEDGMITFEASWHPRFAIKQLGRIGLEGRESREISIGTHTGTHIDAPLHFVKGGRSIDQVPLDLLIGKVSIIDFSSLAENSSISLEMLKNIEFLPRVIFKFGWGRNWGMRSFYKNYPFFSKEAALYLVDQGVKLIGIDTPSPDDSRIKLKTEVLGSEVDSPIHKIFLGANLVLIEYLGGLTELEDYVGWTLIALPLKIKGADGSPARVCLYKD